MRPPGERPSRVMNSSSSSSAASAGGRRGKGDDAYWGGGGDSGGNDGTGGDVGGGNGGGNPPTLHCPSSCIHSHPCRLPYCPRQPVRVYEHAVGSVHEEVQHASPILHAPSE